MNLISAVAEILNFLFTQSYILFNQFFQWNFMLVSFVIECFEIIKRIVIPKASSFLSILHCYYQDFVIFLHEVIAIVAFFIHFMSIFFHRIYLIVDYIIVTIQEFVSFVDLCIEHIFTSVLFFLICVYESISYLLQLIFSSTLLILQLGPNLLIYLYEAFRYLLCCIFTTSKHFLTTSVKEICIASLETILNIPLKAYFGFLLIVIVHNQRDLFSFYLKALTTFLLSFLYSLKEPLCTKTISLLKTARKFLERFMPLREEENDTFYDASNSHLPEETLNNSVQRKNILQKIFRTVNSLPDKCLFGKKLPEKRKIELLQKELEAERDKHACIICCDKPRNILFHPCRHLCVCDNCSSNLDSCPVCRRFVIEDLRVYT